MYLTHLSLTNFRAFTRLDMDLPRRILLLVGDNAQGKTSILEAVFYLATFTSLHAQSDRQLINFLTAEESLAVARLVADFQRGDRLHRLEVRLIQEPVGPAGNRFRKEILLDGVKRTAQEAMGVFNAVIFLPQMMRIVEGGPDERRRYLNLALSQAMPGYAAALSEYSQALAQRNALLKLLAERSGSPDQLDYWDELIAGRGAVLIAARIQAVQEMERLAARLHQKLTHSEEVLRLQYQPSYDPLPHPEGQYALPIQTVVQRNGFTVEQIRQGFLAQLQARRSEELARGVTALGPHRDEMRFLSNGIDLGDFGSRGQIRTALLALKMSEAAWLHEKTGHWPVLLLDEILAELDTQRRADLLDTLGEGEQALLTTTDLKLFSPAFLEQSARWEVRAGQVVKAGN
ncbi:MAG TPA: DNA replication/repair protein RecF [Anaerolineaceae bacterium]|jgi:DNA replication and repair protein RecF|nr:DNA replication/repair protein RecF [Anaerolineaceae bacterium]